MKLPPTRRIVATLCGSSWPLAASAPDEDDRTTTRRRRNWGKIGRGGRATPHEAEAALIQGRIDIAGEVLEGLLWGFITKTRHP